MSLRAFYIFLMALCLSCASTDHSRDKIRAEQHMKIGSGHMQKGNYPSAMSSFLQAHELDPQNPVILHNLGIAYYVRDKFSLAEKNIREAIEISPSFTEARISLGKVLSDMSLYNEALKELKLAEEDLTYKWPHKIQYNMGKIFFKLENYELAESHFKKYLKVNPKNCRAQNFYGRSLFFQKKFRISARSFDRAELICKADGNEDYLYYSALSYYYTARRVNSLARLEKLKIKYPNSVYIKHVNSLIGKLK